MVIIGNHWLKLVKISNHWQLLFIGNHWLHYLWPLVVIISCDHISCDQLSPIMIKYYLHTVVILSCLILNYHIPYHWNSLWIHKSLEIIIEIHNKFINHYNFNHYIKIWAMTTYKTLLSHYNTIIFLHYNHIKVQPHYIAIQYSHILHYITSNCNTIQSNYNRIT